jgi:hypothetical protein
MILTANNKTKHSLPWFTVEFDSATGLANALANALHEEGFPGVGRVPESELLARLVNALPWQLKKNVYIKGSARGAVSAKKLAQVDSEDFSRWMVSRYPAKKYPAIMIGSSSGPAVHLAAAMGIPWLPQTFLIPVKTPSGLSVDDPIARMEWACRPADDLLSANPDLQLHHMMDPNQDRPMLKTTSYFRVKKLRLGEVYKNFIKDHLEEDGVLLIIDCQKSWPVTHVAERYYFQFGGFGGTTIEEYHNGSADVEEFLVGTGSKLKKWKAPKPDVTMPEAEWGFAEPMADDIKNLADENGYQVRRIVFDEPEDFSPYVADLHRWWYRQRGIPANNLLVGMFFLVEPYISLRTGAVPYWLAFNAKPSVENLEAYLQSANPYDYIYLMPFSHGVEGQGLATVEDYRSALNYAKQKGAFIGSEPELYPFDFGIYFRYEKDIRKKLSLRYAADEYLSLDQLDRYNEENRSGYKVDFV